MSAQKSGANQPTRGTEAANKKTKICPLHGPGHSMEEYKVMQAQAKAMKATYESARTGYRPRGKGKNKHSTAAIEEVNTMVKAAVKAALKKKNKAGEADKGQEKDDLYNFDGLNIKNNDSIDLDSD